MHTLSTRGGAAALRAGLLLMISAEAGARRCAADDTVVQLSDGNTTYVTFQAYFGSRCWDPTTFSNVVHLNGSRGCPADSASGCGESLSGCANFDAGAALAEGTYVGKLMMIERGGCGFATKALSAQDAGAIGVLVFSDSRGAAVMKDDGACPCSSNADCLSKGLPEGSNLECPGTGVAVIIPTLMIEAAQGAAMIADPALLSDVQWDCPGTPAEAQCGSLAPTMVPTAVPTTRPSAAPSSHGPTAIGETFHPTSEPTVRPSANPTRGPSRNPTRQPTTSSPTRAPSIAPSTRGPTNLGETFTPTDNPTSSAPSGSPTSSPSRRPTANPSSSAPTTEPTSSPSVYAGPTLQLQLTLDTGTLNDTQIADLEAALQSLFRTAAAAVVPPVFATAIPRVQVLPGGVVTIALLNLNGAGIPFSEVRAVALQLNGTSSDDIDVNENLGGSFGSFAVSASSAMPAPTAPPTAAPSPAPEAPAPEASDTGLDATTIVIIVVGTIVCLLVTLNLAFFFMYRKHDAPPSERPTTAQRKADAARDFNSTANANAGSGSGGGGVSSPPSSPHFYPLQSGSRSPSYGFDDVPGYGGNTADTADSRYFDNNGQGHRVSLAQGRGYAPAQQRQPSIGGGGGGGAGPKQWYPTANNQKKRSPVKAAKAAMANKADKLQQPGQSVLARVGAQPWNFDSTGR